MLGAAEIGGDHEEAKMTKARGEKFKAALCERVNKKMDRRYHLGFPWPRLLTHTAMKLCSVGIVGVILGGDPPERGRP